MDRQHAARLAELIAADFYGKGLKLSGEKAEEAPRRWAEMPEIQAVARLRDAGADYVAVRRFLTFVAAMSRNRNFKKLLCAALDLFGEDRALFNPAVAATTPVPVLKDRLSTSSVSRKHKPDAEAWQTIAGSLTKPGPVMAAINDGMGDATKVFRSLDTVAGGKARFPLLSGPKTKSLWMRLMVAPGKSRLGNLRHIPLAVDVHVRRATERLGVCDTQDASTELARAAIQGEWLDVADMADIDAPLRLGGSCLALDPALWVLGKYGVDEDYRHYRTMA
ncbi:MAG: hypothetical protein F4081_00345, partial [Dehalococcoidia bacterium]|nr:hypothetical protein [Dehalococcoidia bacterium]